MKKLFLLFITQLVFHTVALSQTEIDSTSNYGFSVELDDIILQADKSLKIDKKDNLFVVSVAGSVFEKNESVWQALKQVPLVKIQKDDIKVVNKSAIIEINGNQILLSAEELRNYLSALNPGDVKRIEINPSPGAAYESNVDAVINIILKETLNSYNVGLFTRHGLRSEYFNSSGFNYSLNLKKINIYTDYTFNYNPKTLTASIEQQVFNFPSIFYSNKDKIDEQSHQFNFNVGFKLSKNTQLNLINSFLKEKNISLAANISPSAADQFISIENDKTYMQFGQILKHQFNDRLSGRLGGYEVFNNNDRGIEAFTTLDNTTIFQRIKTDIPLVIAFLDLTSENKWGTTKFGLKYNNTNVNNINEQLSSLINGNFPFTYLEQITAIYADHIFMLSPSKSITVGIRSESTFIKSSFFSELNTTVLERKINYTNPLFNISYDWSKDDEVYHSLSLRSQIQRPNYGYLNPFTQITSNILFFAGDLKIDPSNIYNLQYIYYKEEWSFFTQLGYINQLISTFYNLVDSNIVQTYQNFEHVPLVGVGVEYNKSLWEDKVQLRPNITVAYARLMDNQFTIDRQTPIFNFDFFGSLELGKAYFSVEYSLSPTYRDGLFKHKLSQYCNLNVNFPLFKNFNIVLFANDIFKTQIDWNQTTVPNYFFSNNEYGDNRSFGFRLSWQFRSNLFKKQNFEKIKDDAIDRIN